MEGEHGGGAACGVMPRGRRRRPLPVLFAFAFLAVLTAGITAGVGGRPAGAEGPGGVKLLGYLDQPKAARESGSAAPIAIDVARRRLYVLYAVTGPTNHLLEYDLNPTIPRLLRDVVFPVSEASSNTIAFDVTRGLAYVLDNRAATTASDCPGCSYISVLHLDTMKLDKEVMNLSRAVPNFFGLGLTYSASDDRVYVVGTPAGPVAYVTTIEIPPALPGGIVALTPPTFKVAWSRAVIPQCQMPGLALSQGASLFRSLHTDALYMPCVRPDGPAHFVPYVGQAGLVRLHITPHATSAEAQNFGIDFFPVSGTFTDTNGLAAHTAFDTASERLFLLSSSVKTPGAWVFDGRLPAWVGFVAAHDSQDVGIGVDSASGHFFLRSGDDDNLIVSDARATPVPQGSTFKYSTTPAANWPVDTLTHRVFAARAVPKTFETQTEVLLDETASVLPPKPLDFDTLTTDMAEGPNTLAAFSGNASGFGMREMLVGGYGGLADPLTGLDLPIGDELAQLSHGAVGLSPGGRGITASQVSSVELRNVGATASSQALALDATTAGDYQSKQNTVRDNANGAKSGLGNQIAPLANWPWPAATCLDAGGKPLVNKTAGPAGSSNATCDEAKENTGASSDFGSVIVPGVTVGSSSFQTTVVRDPALGTLSNAVAIAKAVVVSVAGQGTLTIGSIEAKASTSAHGRRGSARASWNTTLDNVVLSDAAGKVLFRCDTSCSAQEVARRVNNSILAVKLRVLIPAAEVVTSPGGAAAVVQKAEADYWSGLTLNDDKSREVPAMQIELYNDSGQKSRLVVQLAAIELDSIYGISARPVESGSGGSIIDSVPDGVVDALGLFVPANVPSGSYGAPAPAPRVAPLTGPLIERVVHGARLVLRSPRDATLFALVCLLFAACIVTVRRRQVLLAQLEDVGPK